MAFDIQQFRSQMRYDGARPNLFECSMQIPGLADNDGTASRQLTFMARAAQLPGSTVNSVPVMYFGRELKFAGNRNFADWSITVINDEDFLVRNAIERWMDGINSHSANIRAGSFQNGLGPNGSGGYQTNAYVTQYSKTAGTGDISNVLRKYKFIGLFPVDVTPIDLDWASNDTIEEYAVTFAYQWWEDDTLGEGAVSVPITT